MSEYTEGEWEAAKSPLGDWVIATDTELICRVVRHYNARLIAAAPDMYEACNKLICNIVFVKTADDRSKNLLAILVNHLEKALAKAEGKL